MDSDDPNGSDGQSDPKDSDAGADVLNGFDVNSDPEVFDAGASVSDSDAEVSGADAANKKRKADSKVENSRSQADTEESADRAQFNWFAQSVGIRQREKDLNLSHREKVLQRQSDELYLQRQRNEVDFQRNELDLQRQRNELVLQIQRNEQDLQKKRDELAQKAKELEARESQASNAQTRKIQTSQDGPSVGAGRRKTDIPMEDREDDDDDSDSDEGRRPEGSIFPNIPVNESNGDGVAAANEFKSLNLPMNFRMPVEIEPAFNELSVQTTYAAINLPMNLRMPVEIEPAFNELSVQTIYSNINLPMNLRMPVEIEPAFNELSVQTIYSNIKLPMNLRMPVEIEPAFNELSVQTASTYIKLPMNLRMPCSELYAFSELVVNGQSRNKSIVINQKWLKQYEYDIANDNADVPYKKTMFYVQVNPSLKEKCENYTATHKFINTEKIDSTAAIILQGSHFPYCPPFAPLLQNSFLEKYSQEFEHYKLTERQCTSVKVESLNEEIRAFISRNVGNITTVQLPQNIKISIQSQNNTICIQDAMDETLPAIVVKHCKLFFTYLLTHCLTNTLTPLSKFNSLAKKEDPEFLHRLQLYSQTST